MQLLRSILEAGELDGHQCVIASLTAHWLDADVTRASQSVTFSSLLAPLHASLHLVQRVRAIVR